MLVQDDLIELFHSLSRLPPSVLGDSTCPKNSSGRVNLLGHMIIASGAEPFYDDQLEEYVLAYGEGYNFREDDEIPLQVGRMYNVSLPFELEQWAKDHLRNLCWASEYIQSPSSEGKPLSKEFTLEDVLTHHRISAKHAQFIVGYIAWIADRNSWNICKPYNKT